MIHQDPMYFSGQFERRPDGDDVFMLFRSGVALGISLREQWLEYRVSIPTNNHNVPLIDSVHLNAALGMPGRLVEIPFVEPKCLQRTILSKSGVNKRKHI